MELDKITASCGKKYAFLPSIKSNYIGNDNYLSKTFRPTSVQETEL